MCHSKSSFSLWKSMLASSKSLSFRYNILNTVARVKANVEICHMSDGSPTCFAVQIPNIIPCLPNKTHLYYFKGKSLNPARLPLGISYFILARTRIIVRIHILAPSSKKVVFDCVRPLSPVGFVVTQSATVWFYASKSKEGWQIGRACRCSVLLKLKCSIVTLIKCGKVENRESSAV